MGGSAWSDDLYRDRATTRAKAGTPTFAYDHAVRTGVVAKKAHASLDPRGVKVRESRDSDAHPNSLAIGVIFDVTGSMSSVPRTVQTKLTKLMELLIAKKYCEDPQILVGSVGDYHSDKVPFQVAQFESGIEIDEQLGHIFLEGGGGGTYEESYQQALYFFARKTSTDCWEKRGKKGFLFIIGDEKPYGAMTPAEIEAVFGDTVQENVLTRDLIREVQERYNLFFVIPNNTSHYSDPVLRDTWAGLIGSENVIMLENPDLICETIGSVVGMFESALTLDMVSTNVGKKDGLVVRNALDKLATSSAVKAVSAGVPATGSGTSNSRL